MCCPNNLRPLATKRHGRFRGSRRGFTLVELMVVIVIIGLLSGVVTLSVRSYLIRSKQNVAKMEISKIVQALETFYTTYDRYPTNQEGLSILSQPSAEFAEGILTFVPVDPWGYDYEYISPGRSKAFDVTCFGSDNREGGAGAAEDLSSNEIADRGARSLR
ncbi:MAG: type II secretion system major pseudopilin GspG [Planctomycetota bacterium]